VEVWVKLCTDKAEDKRRLLEWIDENCKTVEQVGQQRITPSAICERCEKDIYKISKTPEKTIDYSKRFHDGVFCYNCQQKLRKEKEKEEF